MSQNCKSTSLVVLLAALLVTFNSCRVLEDSDLEMKEIYQISDGACGELALSEKLADNFDKAFKKLEEEKRAYFQSFCPDEPCAEIKLETYKIEVEGEVDKEINFKAIQVLDMQSGNLLHSVNDVITSNGYHYNIAWCPD